MEAATRSQAAFQNESISIRFGDVEVRHFQPRKMTDEEFYHFCRANANLRMEQDKFGNITIMPPVSPESGHYESEVGIDLGIWNRKTGRGKTFSPSTMFTLPDGSKRMPDASWISNERYDSLGKKERQTFARIVPDFVVEVRSPSDSPDELHQKMTAVWVANGVRLAWLIDPVLRSARVYRADGSMETVEGFDNRLSGETVLPGFLFDLKVLDT